MAKRLMKVLTAVLAVTLALSMGLLYYRAARVRAAWAAHMQAHGMTAAEAAEAFARWDAEDHYLPLADELDLMAAAGFARPDVYWRRGPCAVYGGFRE